MCHSAHGNFSLNNLERYIGLELNTCGKPVLPERAHLTSSPIIGTERYSVGTHGVACNGKRFEYQEGGEFKCSKLIKDWTGTLGTCSFQEDCNFLILLCAVPPLLYFCAFWSASVLNAESEESIAFNRVSYNRTVDVHESFCGELFGGKIFSPSVLLMNLDGDIRQSGIKKYFMSLSRTHKFIFLLNAADFVTDLLFAQNKFQTNPCIGIISGTSFMISSSFFICKTVVDYKAFERRIAKEDRNLVRLRWDILILTPIEDLIHIVLVLYLFAYNVVDFLSYLNVIFSFGMIICRIFKVFIAEEGGLKETKRYSATPGAITIAVSSFNSVENIEFADMPQKEAGKSERNKSQMEGKRVEPGEATIFQEEGEHIDFESAICI